MTRIYNQTNKRNKCTQRNKHKPNNKPNKQARKKSRQMRNVLTGSRIFFRSFRSFRGGVAFHSVRPGMAFWFCPGGPQPSPAGSRQHPQHETQRQQQTSAATEHNTTQKRAENTTQHHTTRPDHKTQHNKPCKTKDETRNHEAS